MMTSTNKITYRGLAVWLVCALFFMYEFLLRTVLGTFQSPLMSQLHLTPITFALLSSTAYQLIYGLMQLPVGLITERYGLKKTLFTAVIFCVIADAGFALAPTFWVAVLFRTLMGLGSSFGFVCLLVTVYDWMPRKNVALFIGLSQFIGTLGPMMAAGPLDALSENAAVSWRAVFGYLAVIGLVIAILVLFIVDRNKQNRKKRVVLMRPSSVSGTLLQLVRQKQIWFIAIFSACVYFSLEYLSENECKAFLMSKGFSAHFSAYMITIAWLGYAVGCALLGFISDKIQRRKVLMLNSAVMALIALTSIIYLPLGESMTAVSFLLLGVGTSGQSIGFAIMAEQCKESYIAVGLGFNNAMIVLFSAIIAPLIGFILSQLEVHHPLSTLVNHQRAFMVMIALLITAVILTRFFIKETFCKSMQDNIRLVTEKYTYTQRI